MSAQAGDATRPRVILEARIRQGASRVHAAWFPILQASLAAGIAFGLARYVVHHPYPFFAPVCAWVALGFASDRSLRRVSELAVGVAIGVALGDVLVHLIGNGVWQVAVVLFVAATIARFIDRGVLLTTQAGVQALVIVGLPALTASGGPLGRWIDAAIGGAVALVVAVLTPRDPRRHSRALARTACDELAGVLRLFGRGLRTGSSDDVEDALVRARASQPAFDEWSDTARNAGELARISPAIRRFRGELAALEGRAVLVDRAMRNTRVLVRRSLAAVEAGTHDLSSVAAHVDATARAAAELSAAFGSGRDPARARTELLAIAQSLDPYALDDWQVQSLVLLHRSLVVDLLEASGAGREAARDALPEI